ncbi:MAG: 5-(carboxyamino)imidazole ribonucleotide synthase [Ignavibacteria bacterium]|nr:5-(carboxyamino)imidazole ribonucleotide synthase [Ignavibacteria bacterium]
MVIGILGGGQLARMIIEETGKFGFRYKILSDIQDSPAGQICSAQVIGRFTDYDALKKFADGCSIITLENEFIDKKYVEYLESLNIKVLPGSAVVGMIQDKLMQKNKLRDIGIPVPAFGMTETKEDIEKFARRFGYPLILKSRTMGYDGKGNFKIDNKDQIKEAFDTLKGRGKLLCEEFVDFTRELAVQAVKSTHGEIKIYPVVESIQKDHICNIVKVQKNFDKNLTGKINLIAEKVLNGINYTGVLGIELFELKNGDVIVNELAPRVHNTGHYTTEGCYVSQFENHIRAILGMPLGSVEMKHDAAVMINIIGDRNGKASPEGFDELLRDKNAFMHIYGKEETRKGRKMGHITVTGDELSAVLLKAKELHSKIKI